MASASSRVSALFTACARGNLTAVRLVLEHGDGGDGNPAIDTRTQDQRGDTALHVAASHQKWPVVSWLTANGSDPDVRNVAGHTALDVCPSSEARDVYIAILARAPSPRANRTARRIAASPPSKFLSPVEPNAENQAPVPIASPVTEKQPEPVSPRQPIPDPPTMAETLRFDLEMARREMRELENDAAGPDSPRAMSPVGRSSPAHHQVPETPNTTRKVLKSLDRKANGFDRFDTESHQNESISFGNRSDDSFSEIHDDEDVAAFVPKSLLRRAAFEVRRVTNDLKQSRLVEMKTREELDAAKQGEHRALAAELIIRETTQEKVSTSLSLEQIAGAKDAADVLLQERNDELKELRAALGIGIARTTIAESEAKRLESSLESALKNVTRETALRAELELQLEQTEKSLADERGARRDAMAVSSSKAMDADDALAEAANAKKREDKLHARTVEAERNAVEASGQLEETRKSLKDAENVIRELRRDLVDAKSISETATVTATKATTQCESLLTQNETLAKRLKRSGMEYDETREQLAVLKEKFANAKGAETKLEAALTKSNALRNELDSTKAEWNETRLDRDSVCENLAESRVRIVELEAQIASLQSALDDSRTDEDKRRVKLLERVAGRMRNKTISAAFLKWVECIEETVRIRVTLQRVAAKFSRRKEAAAFEKWRHEAEVTREAKAKKLKSQQLKDARKEKAETEAEVQERLLRRAAAKIFGNRLHNCFERWRTLSHKSKQEKLFTQKVDRKLSSLRMRSAFSDWLGFLDDELNDKEVVENTMRKALRAYGRGMLRKWRTTTVQRNVMRKRMRVVVDKFRWREKEHAFSNWSGNVYELQTRKRVIDRAVGTIVSKRLKKAWVQFTGGISQSHRAQALIERSLQRRARHVLTTSLNNWVTHVQSEKTTRVATSRFISKRRKTLLTEIFKFWRTDVSTLKKLTVAGSRVLARMTRRTLAMAFDQWIDTFLGWKEERVERETRFALEEAAKMVPVSPNTPRGLKKGSTRGSMKLSDRCTRSSKNFPDGFTSDASTCMGSEVSEFTFERSERLKKISTFVAKNYQRKTLQSLFTTWRLSFIELAKERLEQEQQTLTEIGLTMKSERATERREIADVHEQHGRVKERNLVLENELKSVTEKSAELTRFVETSKTQIGDGKALIAENKALAMQLAQTEQLKNKLESESRYLKLEAAKEKRSALDAKKEKKEVLAKNNAIVESQLETERRLKAVETERAELEAKLALSTQKIETVKQSKSSAIKKHRARIEIMTAAADAMKREIQTLNEDVLSANAHSDHLNEKVVSLEAELLNAADGLNALSVEFEQKRKEQTRYYQDETRRVVLEAVEESQRQSNREVEQLQRDLFAQNELVVGFKKRTEEARVEAEDVLGKYNVLSVELTQLRTERDVLVGLSTPTKNNQNAANVSDVAVVPNSPMGSVNEVTSPIGMETVNSPVVVLGASDTYSVQSPPASFKQSDASAQQELECTKQLLTECEKRVIESESESARLREELEKAESTAGALETELKKVQSDITACEARCAHLQTEHTKAISAQQTLTVTNGKLELDLKVANEKVTTVLNELRTEKANASEASSKASSQLTLERKQSTMESDFLKTTVSSLEQELLEVKQNVEVQKTKAEKEIALANKAKESAAVARAKEAKARRSKETDLSALRAVETELNELRQAFEKTCKRAATATASAAKLRVRERELVKKAKEAKEKAEKEEKGSEGENHETATKTANSNPRTTPTPRPTSRFYQTPLSSRLGTVNQHSVAQLERRAFEAEQAAAEAETNAAASADAAEAAERVCFTVQQEAERAKRMAQQVVEAAEDATNAAEVRERKAVRKIDQLRKELGELTGSGLYDEPRDEQVYEADAFESEDDESPKQPSPRQQVSPPTSPPSLSPVRRNPRVSRLRATLEESKNLME